MDYSKISKIKSKSEFICFLRDLKEDYIDNLQTWENRDIGNFLEAMASWIEDMDGFYTNQGLSVPEALDWKVFADILMGGKLYE